MRVGREWDDCIAQQGVLFLGGEDQPRADSQGVRRLGEGSSRRLGLRLSKP
jgi:hypothetical protein